MNEHNIQKLLVAWFRKNYPNMLLFSIPNGGLRDSITAKRLKDEGLTPGIPDLFLAYKGGLFIEMKAKNGKLSDNQKKIHTALKAQGYKIAVPHSYEEAKDCIKEHLA